MSCQKSSQNVIIKEEIILPEIHAIAAHQVKQETDEFNTYIKLESNEGKVKAESESLDNISRNEVSSQKPKDEPEEKYDLPKKPELFMILQCVHCERNFSTKKQLTEHLLIHAINNLHQNDAGNKLSINEGDQIIHSKLRIMDPLYEYDMSKNSYSFTYSSTKCTTESDERKSSEMTATEFHDSIDVFKCDICRNTFAKKDSVKRHVMTIHIGENKSFTCEACGKKWQFRSDFVNHMAVHSLGIPNYCSICDKNYSCKSNFDQHSILHAEENPHKCTLCGKKCLKKYELIKHMRIHNGKMSSENCYKCNICDKSFSKRRRLNEHVKIHTERKKYQCNVCGRTQLSRSKLETHMKTHTGEKPHECQICGKKWFSKRELIVHTRVHTGKKLHECNICSKKYLHKSGLVSHVRSHTGERPYKCSVCEKAFSKKISLVEHLRHHAEEKPYKCNICSREYVRKCDLKKHMKIHADELCKCDICNKMFTCKAHMNKHLKSHAGTST